MFFDAYMLMTKCNKENKASIWRRSWRRRDFKEKMWVCSKDKMIAICKWRPAQHSEEKGISKAQRKFWVLKFFFKQYKQGFLKIFKKIWIHFQAFLKFENKFFKKFVHCGGAWRGGEGRGGAEMGRVSPKTHPHPHPCGGYEFYTRTRPMIHQIGTHPLGRGWGGSPIRPASPASLPFTLRKILIR